MLGHLARIIRAMTTATSTPTHPESRLGRDVLELLASMRFAISLLCIICIASVIGTVVRQNEPYNNYVNQFGPFWAEVFAKFDLYTVYSATWFLVILAFLVISTSLCIVRNAPKILADLRSYKEHIREQSLRAFHHRAEGSVPLDRAGTLAHLTGVLAARGWQAKAQVRDTGTMVAARKGSANKLGYLAAHSAIVLICLGGLLDGNLIVQAQMWWQGKSVFEGGGMIRDVPDKHRLSENNPTFRGNLFVSEGTRAGIAVLSTPDGSVLQDLPFDVELKKFKVEYYDTGMPKLFASDVIIHDRDTGASTPATIKVNEPTHHRGIAIYQSSFDDGGSLVKLKGLPLNGSTEPLALELRVGESTQLSKGAETLGLELTGLKVINVENMSATGSATESTDVRKVDLTDSLNKHLGSGAKGDRNKTLRNVGPAVTYKLVDAAGQRREFHNYMVPVELDGQRLYLFGVRENVNEAFRYLRIPVDEQGDIAGWVRLRQALMDPALRDKAAQRFAAIATPPNNPQMAEQLRQSSRRALALFAGQDASVKKDAPGGLAALSQYIEATVPEAERSKFSEVLLRILNSSLFELNQTARERDGLKPLEASDDTSRFMTQAVMSISDSFFYPAPMVLQLDNFEQVQASVFQVARAPGKTLVYLGAILLIVGVIMMLYVRERRLWIWLTDTPDKATQVLTALSTPRRTLDADAEFEALRQEILAPGLKTQAAHGDSA
jgi:cytochrome c biogenesis protein